MAYLDKTQWNRIRLQVFNRRLYSPKVKYDLDQDDYAFLDKLYPNKLDC